jgi:flagellar biosynthetic protein FliQ
VSDASVLEVAIAAMQITAKLCAPILVVSLAIGFAVSVLQSMTQIQEVTLTFVPKLIGVGLVIAVAGNWMLAELIGFTNQMFEMVPSLIAAS